MELSCGNCHNTVQSCRYCALAAVVCSPGGNRAVTLERQTVSITSCDRHHAGQPWRHSSLTTAIGSPGDYAVVIFERQIVVVTACNRHDVVQSHWNAVHIVQVF